jgi:hypothetical protein
VRILVVTNAYPAPARPAYGIYVARLVAALERDGHEIVLVASSEVGGGWRTVAKYARLAWKAVRPRAAPGPMSWGHHRCPLTIAPPGSPGGARALRADRAPDRRHECRALARIRRATLGALAVCVKAVCVSTTWRRGSMTDRRAARRAHGRRQRGRRPGGSATAIQGRGGARLGTRTGCGSPQVASLIPRKNIRLPRGFAAARLSGRRPLAPRWRRPGRGARALATDSAPPRVRCGERGPGRGAALAARVRSRLPGLIE